MSQHIMNSLCDKWHCVTFVELFNIFVFCDKSTITCRLASRIHINPKGLNICCLPGCYPKT